MTYYDDIRDTRQQWASQFDRCMHCGVQNPWPPLQTHEIERRSQSPGAWADDVNYLRLCQGCHDEVSQWPHAKQLALKWKCDPIGGTIEGMVNRWLNVAGRPAAYLTDRDVRSALATLSQWCDVRAGEKYSRFGQPR